MKPTENTLSLGTQGGAILERLRRQGGQWVSILDLFRASDSMNVCNRVRDLRKKINPLGYDIENKLDRVQNASGHYVMRSYYRLVKTEGGHAS